MSTERVSHVSAQKHHSDCSGCNPCISAFHSSSTPAVIASKPEILGAPPSISPLGMVGLVEVSSS